ncbi:hypothetical protein KDE13_08290 [Campylobacter sp. faydin G-140]|nr:hypothetical protein [Campylobacter anatolicus]MBR8461443.1 hypothetical protein [Campylobacter anatolicus]MBR8466330.1 hypothetical protein [Campylobacter anatolicus]
MSKGIYRMTAAGRLRLNEKPEYVALRLRAVLSFEFSSPIASSKGLI